MAETRLVYFNIRGIAEPVRWMMKISGMDFVDERIPLDAWATTTRKGKLIGFRKFSRQDSDFHPALRNFVGQLPILFIGEDFVLTQPLTVLRFLARKCGLQGQDFMEEARAEEVSDLVYDLRLKAIEFEGKSFKSLTPDIVRHTVFRDFRNAAESPEKEKMRDSFRLLYFPLYFNKFDSILTSSGGEWIAGKNLTYGDLVVANFLDIAQDLVDPTCLNEFPRLKELMDRVLAIPQIDEWRRGEGQLTLIQNPGTNGDNND